MLYSHNKKAKVFLGDIKVKRVYIGDRRVYSAGNIVTYHVDAGKKYTEEVDSDATCLKPTTFTPTKPGWNFVGWREDKTANGSVLSSKIMDDAPITLYAVFSQTITLSYNGNGSTSGSTSSESKTRYYNNENIKNPAFTVKTSGFTKSGYTFLNWMNTTSGATYNVGQSIELSQSITLYASWEPNEIIVYQQVIDGDVKIHNKNYVTMDARNANAGVWYRLDDATGYNNIYINYGRYKTAVIDFEIVTNNIDVWYEGDRKIEAYVAGQRVYSSTDQYSSDHYTLTTTATTIATRVYADNSDHNKTWVHGWLYPIKITLKR